MNNYICGLAAYVGVHIHSSVCASTVIVSRETKCGIVQYSYKQLEHHEPVLPAIQRSWPEWFRKFNEVKIIFDAFGYIYIYI